VTEEICDKYQPISEGKTSEDGKPLIDIGSALSSSTPKWFPHPPREGVVITLSVQDQCRIQPTLARI
jgi:hypothetical protein